MLPEKGAARPSCELQTSSNWTKLAITNRVNRDGELHGSRLFHCRVISSQGEDFFLVAFKKSQSSKAKQSRNAGD